jgi:hypothetical protein
MIDRVVHHADVLTLKGASYGLSNRGIDTLPNIRTQDPAHQNHKRMTPFSSVTSASNSSVGDAAGPFEQCEEENP